MIDINWDRELNQPPQDIPELWKRLCRGLSGDMLTIKRRLGGAGSANITVIASSGSSGGGSGSSAVATEYRAKAFTASAGAVVISFSSAMPSASYRAIVLERDSFGVFTVRDESTITKSTSGFSFTSLEDISGFYIVIADE